MSRLQNAHVWLALGLAIFTAILMTPVVSAHAYLIRSEPANNAVLDEPPPEVRLWFSEPISPEFSTIQILDINGQALKPVQIQVDPTETGLMIITMPKLAAGLYSLRWNVLSEADGHFTQGPLIFGIGQVVNREASSVAAPVVTVFWTEVLLRWLNFGALLGLVGSIAVAYWVLAPADAPSSEEHDSPSRDDTENENLESKTIVLDSKTLFSQESISPLRTKAHWRVLGWAKWCAGSALVVGLGLLVWQVVTLTESLPDNASVWRAGWQLLQSRWGLLWLARQIVLLLLLGLTFNLYVSTKRPTQQHTNRLMLICVFVLALSLLALQSLASHAAGLNQQATLALITDMLHLLAASMWIGGLLALAIGLLPLLSGAEEYKVGAILVKSFSRFAAISVGLLLATGLYSMGRQITSIDALLTTLYGQALLSKIGLMLAVGFIGLLNAILLHPRLAAPLAWLLNRPPGWTPLSLKRLPALVLAEAGVGLLVILATAFITAAPPARGPEFEVAAGDIPTSLSQTVEDMVITFSASPNRPGQNLFTIRAVSTRRPAPAEIIRLIVRFTFLGQEMGRSSVDAKEIEPGLYQAGGNYLSLAGPWQVQVVVRRAGIEDAVANFNWVVAPPGQARPVLISNSRLEPILTILAALFILMMPLMFIIARLGRNKFGKFIFFQARRNRGETKHRNEDIDAHQKKRERLKHVKIFIVLVALLAMFSDVARADKPLSAPFQAPPPAGSGQESNGVEKIVPEVWAEMQSLPKGEMLTVIVTLKEQANLNSLRVQNAPNRAFRNWAVVTELQSTANLSQRGLKALLGVRQAEGLVSQVIYFWIFNGLAVTATPEVIRELAALPQVLKITPNETYQAPFAPLEPGQLSATANQPNLDLINAPALWAMGFKGQGIVVANTDTGVNLSHPDLGSKWRGGTNSWYDPYGQNPTPVDDSDSSSTGHGTQTMGIMVGDDDGGVAYGVAPNATWIAVKIFNNSGGGTALAFHQGLQWLLDPDGIPATADAPHVVNNSWIVAQGCNLEYQLDLQAMRAAGILPIFSAGNTAATTHSPANYPEAFAVGAVNNSDVIWASSSRGPSSCGEASTIYPEVVAPGVTIHTANSPTPQYTNVTGTSAAAPHVAGVLALLLSASPNMTVDQQQAALLNTVVDLGATGPDNMYGYGRINVLAAYQSIATYSLYLPVVIK